MNLQQFFPTHVELEQATVRAVAGVLLKVLRHQFGETGTFNIRNVLIQVRDLYEVRRWECARAVSEALTWLSAQSLICQAPDGPDGQVKLPHLWPPKLLQAGRGNYAGSEVVTRRAEASFSR